MRRIRMTDRDPLAPQNLKTPRAAAVAGIIFSALLITALVLLRLSTPAHPSATSVWLSDPGSRAEVAIAMALRAQRRMREGN